ncbi:NUDIX domain-containing protein [Pantoea sp. At-9b]|uniref:NUDIX hydrolase n=1 Tax=Pantoea sp. (strain At-9b) TaxID=592316 RepID=UPI0001B3F130|nr:NUDIX domain-containing protein [Pantoea sp. At-9b]ADU72027.1 NUDIX hydrolase [Pantoea sp. At-9b]
MVSTGTIRIAAAVITDNDGRCLLVRKKNTSWFMQPGGKIDGDETPQQALQRELREELNFTFDADACHYLGCFHDQAANEPGQLLVAELFRVETTITQFSPAAEIAEVVWFDPQHDELPLAPLTEKQVLPLVNAPR